MVLGYNLLYSYLLTLLLLKSPWKDVNITPSRASLRQNHGRFFVTGKPFRLFFPLAYYNFVKSLIYFNWRVSCYPLNVSIGKWGRVKTWNMVLDVLVSSYVHLIDTCLKRIILKFTEKIANEDWPRDLVSFCI